MTSRDFAYWLQGLFELGNPKSLDERQTDLVKRHLAMVFVHEIDPSSGGPAKQSALDAIHGIGQQQPTPAQAQVAHIGGEGPGGVKFRC